MPFAAIAAILALVWSADKIGWFATIVIIVLLIGAAVMLSERSEVNKQNILNEAKDSLNRLLERNRGLVDRTALHTFQKSHMGIINADRFHKEIITFLEVHADQFVRDSLAANGKTIAIFYRENMGDTVAQKALVRLENDRQVEKPVSEMTPVEYEKACANLFRSRGWSTEMTAATGDQGVDIVIKKQGKVGVVQCKRYVAPVGNSAVQEVAAGRSHYRASIAIVVSPSGFTRSAKQLAESTNVHLLHHEEIKNFVA